MGINLFGFETHVRPLGSRFLHASVVPTDDGQYLSTIEVEGESGIVYRRALRFASSEQAHIDLTSQLHLMNETPLEDLQRCAEQTVEDDEPFAFSDHRKLSRLAGIGDMGKLSPFGEQLQSEVPGSEVELRVKPLNQDRQIVDLENLFVPKDQRNQGVGSGYMERIVRWADENNVWLTLSLADKNKERGTTSSTRLEKFYRQFGFVPNRGRHKDFALSLYTNMYRAPKGGRTAARQTTLNQIVGRLEEGELLFEHVGLIDMDKPLTVFFLTKDQIGNLRAPDGRTIVQAYKSALRSQKNLVQQYSKQNLAGEVVIVSGDELVDGYHRAMAAFITGQGLQAVDLDELAIEGSEQEGEFDTHVPTSIDDPRPKLHYLSRKLAMTKSGYWINYQTGTEVGVGEHEAWLRNPQNAQMIGVPPQIVVDFAKFEPVKDRDALLRYVMQHAPIMRVRGHGREISFEYSSSRSKGPLDAIWTWAEREAGPLTSLFIANLATGETTSMLYKDFVETMNNSGYEGIMRRASREVSDAGA